MHCYDKAKDNENKQAELNNNKKLTKTSMAMYCSLRDTKNVMTKIWNSETQARCLLKNFQPTINSEHSLLSKYSQSTQLIKETASWELS